MNGKTTHPDQPIRVMLVEDEALLRTVAKCVLERKGEVKVVAQASTGEAAVRMYRDARPDVVLMDIQMPGAGGIVATARIRAQDRAARILIWSSDAREITVCQAREAGAMGFVDKSGPNGVLERAVHQVAQGATFFAPGLLLPARAGAEGRRHPTRGTETVRETWKHLCQVPVPCPLLAQEL